VAGRTFRYSREDPSTDTNGGIRAQHMRGRGPALSTLFQRRDGDLITGSKDPAQRDQAEATRVTGSVIFFTCQHSTIGDDKLGEREVLGVRRIGYIRRHLE